MNINETALVSLGLKRKRKQKTQRYMEHRLCQNQNYINDTKWNALQIALKINVGMHLSNVT